VKILFAMPQRFSLFISIQFTKFGFLIIIYCLSFCENVSYLTLKIFFLNFLSVKIWLANIEALNQCTNTEEVPFALIAEVQYNSHRSTIHICH
jgi:hypothetical protein